MTTIIETAAPTVRGIHLTSCTMCGGSRMVNLATGSVAALDAPGSPATRLLEASHGTGSLTLAWLCPVCAATNRSQIAA